MTALAALERIGQGGVNLTTTVRGNTTCWRSGAVGARRRSSAWRRDPGDHHVSWCLLRRCNSDPTGAAGAAGDKPGRPDPAEIAEMVNDVEAFAQQFDV